MKKITFVFILLILFCFSYNAQTVTDIDGNVYETVTIGNQCWMKQNLKTTKYRDGSPIEYVADTADWNDLTSDAFCWYNNSLDSCNTYGALYNWHAATSIHNLAPEGWHVSTDAEWEAMVDFLGSGTGGQLKEEGIEHWKTPNTSASNSSGFTALPGGYRGISGTFYQNRSYGSWWSTSEYSESSAWSHELYYISPGILRVFSDKNYAFSIRCVKDDASNINGFINDSNLKIYPNPTSDKLVVELCNTISNNDLFVLNSLGQVVYSSVIQNKAIVNLSDFENGVYFIKIITAKSTLIRKVVKQ